MLKDRGNISTKWIKWPLWNNKCTKMDHQHTITCSTIVCLTFSMTSFQCLTPIRGVFGIVNITTSSTNVRLLSPHGPPIFGENSILSFWCWFFSLLFTAARPFKVPRPTCFPPTYNQKRKVSKRPKKIRCYN